MLTFQEVSSSQHVKYRLLRTQNPIAEKRVDKYFMQNSRNNFYVDILEVLQKNGKVKIFKMDKVKSKSSKA